jgi:hypothetical protein
MILDKKLYGSWEHKHTWKDHQELRDKCSQNNLDDLTHMLGENWTIVPINTINRLIREFNKEVLQHEIETSVAAFDKLK